MSQANNQENLKSSDQQKADTELSAGGPNTEALVSVDPIAVREATQADVSFIFNSWLKSYQSACKHIAAPVYFEFQHKLIEAILRRSTVLVAVNSTDDTQIYAYLVFEKIDGVPVLHYAYTKHTYRKIGVLRKLLKNASVNLQDPCFITHKTAVCSKIKAKGLVFNPYLAYGVL